MPKSGLRWACACALISALFCALPSSGQEVNSGWKASLANSLQLEKKLTVAQRRSLSSATRTRFALAHRLLENPGPTKAALSGASHAKRSNVRVQQAPSGMVPISSPAFDYTLSRGGGFSQNDTATAWCGHNVVTGYNDSAALLATLVQGGALSFSGVAHSDDAGKTFTDLGALDPGTRPFNFLVGNPSIACGDATHFYYASMFATTVQVNPNKLIFKEAISVNASSDGGRTWSSPTPAVLMNSANILERESLAIDPSNPQRLYVSFTDIDFETARGGRCAGDSQMLIELASSADGGQTWAKPRIIERICGSSGNAANGSQVAVGPTGIVYVAYLVYDNANGRELIRVRKSKNHGAGFGAAVDVSTVVPAGSGGMLQGLFLSNEFPSISVDRSNGSHRETVYVAWTDGRNRSQADLFSGGTYNFADVLLAKSTDLGNHWSSAIGVSLAAPDASRDQFMPGVAVDSSGRLSVCYSDRRNDPQNDAIDQYCSVSQDGGATFHDLRLTGTSWSPGHFTDLVLNTSYMQDYNVVSPDWTGANAGFFAGFQFQSYGNPNAFGARF